MHVLGQHGCRSVNQIDGVLRCQWLRNPADPVPESPRCGLLLYQSLQAAQALKDKDFLAASGLKKKNPTEVWNVEPHCQTDGISETHVCPCLSARNKLSRKQSLFALDK